jgi:hypothetical protein
MSPNACMQCVAQTRQIHGIPEHCCSEYLKEELVEKVGGTPNKRVLIFTFGNVDYRFFQDSEIFELKKVYGKSKWNKDESVTKRHGYLHKYTYESSETGKKEVYVIHLTHLSKRARIFTLRESYRLFKRRITIVSRACLVIRRRGLSTKIAEENIIMGIFIKNLVIKCVRALYGECNDHACD